METPWRTEKAKAAIKINRPAPQLESSTMKPDLHIHQEVLLLALTDHDGNFSNGMIDYAIAGAMLSDLSLLGKIEFSNDKYKTVRVVESGSTGNSQLDSVIEKINKNTRPKNLQHWVMKIVQTSGLKHLVAKSLCEMGILEETTAKVLFLFTKKVYPELDGSYEDVIRSRMSEVMFHPGVKSDPRTAVLIAFAYHCSLLKQNFAPVELKQHHDRIKKLATQPNEDLLYAYATKAAIDAVNAAVMAAVILPSIIATTASVNS